MSAERRIRIREKDDGVLVLEEDAKDKIGSPFHPFRNVSCSRTYYPGPLPCQRHTHPSWRNLRHHHTAFFDYTPDKHNTARSTRLQRVQCGGERQRTICWKMHLACAKGLVCSRVKPWCRPGERVSLQQ